MWRKTVWLIAILTLSIFVAPVAWAQNPGKLYRVGMVFVSPPNLLPPNVPQPSFGKVDLPACFWIGWPTTATFRERTSSSKRGSEDTSDWRNLQRS